MASCAEWVVNKQTCLGKLAYLTAVSTISQKDYSPPFSVGLHSKLPGVPDLRAIKI